MLLRQGVKAALPNTEKQTHGDCQTEEKKNHGPNERTEQNSKNRELNKMETSTLLDAELKTLVIGCSVNLVRT